MSDAQQDTELTWEQQQQAERDAEIRRDEAIRQDEREKLKARKAPNFAAMSQAEFDKYNREHFGF
jgi:hypothetical protein